MAEIKDPIAFELFKNTIFSIADEMALTICRTTYSGVLRDNMDFSTAFADASGKLVAQGLTLPGHLGSIPDALDVVVERFGAEMKPFQHKQPTSRQPHPAPDWDLFRLCPDRMPSRSAIWTAS